MGTQTWLRMILLAGFVVTSGCYSYTPTEMAAVPPGESVRLMVTRAGSEELARVMDSNELRPVIRGRFVGREEESLMLRIPVMTDPTRVRSSIEQVVRVPEGEVLAVDRRTFSKSKTGLLVGAGVAGTAFLLFQVFDVFSDGTSRDPGDDVLIRLPVPIG